MRTCLLTLVLAASGVAGEPLIQPKLDPKPARIVVMGPVLTPAPGDTPVTVPPGRFFSFKPADSAPSYIPSTDAYRIYKVKPGSVYIGIKFDAGPLVTEPEEYSWPDVKETVYVLLARNKPGTTHTIQPLKNGPETEGPVNNGAPFTIIISGHGPQPPPIPTPDPKPAPIDSLFPTLQAAFTADGSPAECAKALAGLYRQAAKDGKTVDDPAIQTTAALYVEMKKVANALSPLPTGQGFREVIAAELDAKIGRSATAPLTTEKRTLVKEQFNRIAALLDSLK